MKWTHNILLLLNGRKLSIDFIVSWKHLELSPFLHVFVRLNTYEDLFRKRVVGTEFDINVFITITGSIPLLVDY